MIWLWVGLVLLILVAVPLYLFHRHIFRKYIPLVGRIFQEKPLFIIPFGQPIADAEEVVLPTTHNLQLHGCYLKTSKPRKGVILFGLEFGSNRWSCQSYCDFLRDSGYDVFSFETRGQGNSPSHEGYEPLQWVTTFDIDDFRAAVKYLKGRPDADPRGIGLFGLSKGGSTGLFLAAEDPYIRCCAVDGIFSTYTTMVPYMVKWVMIYTHRKVIRDCLPMWYFRYAARTALHGIERDSHCVFPYLENVIRKIAPRPLLMIHGDADNYIKPEMAKQLFDMAGKPKEFWLVEGAKHNQSIHVAGDEYKRRIVEFFDKNLAEKKIPSANGTYEKKQAVQDEVTI